MITNIVIAEDGTEKVSVHFECFDPEAKRAMIPCMPNAVLQSINGRPFPHQRTNEPGAVTCDTCKRTAEYMKAKKQSEAVH